MIRFLLMFSILHFSFMNLSAQDISELQIYLFEKDQDKISYTYTYEVYAEGENTIDKTEISNNLSFTKVDQLGDTTIIAIHSDSTKISNKSALEDGEMALLYAMVGLDVQLKLWAEGDSIDILNKEEIVNEFEQGISGHSPESRKAIVQSMLSENEEMFYAMISYQCVILIT